MKKPTQHLIAEVPRKRGQVELTIGIDLGDVWSHYCTLNQQGEVIDRGRFRTTPKPIDTWFTDVLHARVAMEAGVHAIWISEQLEQLGHEVIVANVRELRAISHSDRKSDDVDAEKLARYACLDPEILDSGFSRPNGIAVDGSGNVFVADGGNNTVKEIDLTSPARALLHAYGRGQHQQQQPQKRNRAERRIRTKHKSAERSRRKYSQPQSSRNVMLLSCPRHALSKLLGDVSLQNKIHLNRTLRYLRNSRRYPLHRSVCG